MVFARPNYLLTSGIVLFGLLLLAATLLTRRQRPHPLLHKAIWLVAAGAILAAAGGGVAFSAILLATAGLTYWIATRIERELARERVSVARAWLACGLVANALALVAMKSAPVFAFAPGLLAVGARDPFLGSRVLIPAGLSFLMFHAASFLVDVFRRRAHTHGTSQAGVYLMLLPQFVAGPVSYRAAVGQLARRSVGMSDFAYGVRRLAIGIGKRLFIAGPCAVLSNDIFARPGADLTAAAAWLAAACFAVQVYFTFSGYADMAIGLGRLFGLRLEENFRWPYESGSIGEFWQRWHMGLTAWFREYIAPLAGRYARTGSLAAEALVVLLTALWYGTTWSCLAWGTYHALFLTLERRRVFKVTRMPSFFRHAYVVLVVVIGGVLLRAATPAHALAFFKAMAGLNTPLRFRTLPVSLNLWIALAAGAIGSAPLARSLRRWSVAIDAATTSAVMMLFATVVFVWRVFARRLPRRYGMET